MNRLDTEGLYEAAQALKAMVHGDGGADISPAAEVGFLMLAKVYQCFVVDHTAHR